MKICIVGSGYVGLVTGACLANLGNQVFCIDNNKKKVSDLNNGQIPFYEPALKELVSKNLKGKRLSFDTDLAISVRKADVIFIAVGTPPGPDGSADVTSVKSVAVQIAKILKKNGLKKNEFKIIVNKSTVPVGMGDIVTKLLLKEGVSPKKFTVVSNPEFLREGSAISDFMNPDRIVIGASSNKAFDIISELYRPLNAHIIFTDVKTAEMIKYVSNSFLATKISFINEIANICEKVGADVVSVAGAVGLDKRIGREFLNAGIGYGGSCLPKDISALVSVAKNNGYEAKLLSDVNKINENQIERFVQKIDKVLKGIKGKKIAVLGVAFKPETDDLRDAPSTKLINRLSQLGANIGTYDPVLHGKNINGMRVSDTVKEAVNKADAIVIATEWPEFRELDFEGIKLLMNKKPIIFDGRNIYDPKRITEYGFQYYGVGR